MDRASTVLFWCFWARRSIRWALSAWNHIAHRAVLFFAWLFYFGRCMRRLVAGEFIQAIRMFPGWRWARMRSSAAAGRDGTRGLGAEYATTSRYTTISLCMLLD